MSRQPHESEAELFREAVGDAEPIVMDQAEPFRRRPPPVPITQPSDLRETDRTATLSESEVETPEYLLFARPGVQKRLISDLQRGYIAVDLEVDLHGLTVVYAERVLDEFLRECGRRRVRCARIIHGKGSRSAEGPPVLKRKVNYWLRLREQVLAFSSATRRDGGIGALYVLLRNPDKGERRGRRR
ncbi:MAG: Smr/MutS family protein [Chromatiaceae bacterium]